MESYSAKVVKDTYQLIYTNDEKEIATICKRLLKSCPVDSQELLGFDIETTGLDPHTSDISTVQIYYNPDKISICLHIKNKIPDELVELLTTRNIVAHNANFELKFLLNRGIYPEKIHCSMLLYKLWAKAAFSNGGVMKGSLEAAMKTLYNFKTDKTQQVSEWGAEELSREQKFYAAIDSVLTYLVFSRTKEYIQKYKVEPILNFYKLNRQTLIPIALMSEVGIKLDVDSHTARIIDWEKDKQDSLIELAKYFPTDLNLNSGKQFSEWIADNLPKKYLDEWPVNKTGLYKKDKLTIQKFSFLEEIAALADYSKMNKLLSTYGESLQKLINPKTNRVHCSFWQCHTATGRLSSSEPNMQQQPKGNIRSIFISEPDMSLICADYSQVEVRVLAYIAKESAMINEYKKGTGADFYKLVASKLLGKPFSSITKDERQLAKAVVLGKLYGMGAEKLRVQATYQFKIKMDLQEAKEFLWLFENGFPEYRKWKKDVVRAAEYTLSVQAIGGCIRRLEDDKTYNISLNHPIQSCAAAINLSAIKNVYENIKKYGQKNARILLSVHDEIVVECKDSLVDECKELVEEGMVRAFTQYFPEATTVGLVEAKSAKNWYEAK